MKWWKRALGAGVVAGAVYALWRAIDARTRTSPIEWRPQPFPSPPMPQPRVPESAGATASAPEPDAQPAPGPAPTADPAWVEPSGDACPASHPLKAKLASGIFHSPDGQMYARTVPDRCYRDAAAAEADGLRASKR